jgi:pimeloyl-ACP methyl ester carboxylesterase
MKYLEIDSLRIAYRTNDLLFEDGRKSLVFVHGSGGDSSVWERQLEALGNEFNIIAVDLPGHGRSGGAGEEDVFRYAEWIRKVMESIPMEKPVLVGHSLGAAISIALALTCDDMLSGIVIVGGGARMPVNQMVFDGIKSNYSEFVALSPNFAVHRKNRERLRGFLTENFSEIDPSVFYNDFISCDRFDVTEKLGQIRLPTLIICGEDDKLMPPKFSSHLHDNISNSRLVLIPECGHFFMMEDEDVFITALRDFV